MGAAALLFLGQRAQHHAGRLRRRRGRSGGAAAARRRGLAAGAAGAARLATGAPAPRAGAAASGLPSAPSVRRFLTSTTTCLLRPWLKLWRTTPVSVRGLSDSVDFRDAQRLAVRGLGLSHSVLESCQFRSRPAGRRWPVSPVRKRSRRAKRARNVSFAGPASRAACTTFDRPNAKSNWAVVKALMTAIAVGVVAAAAARRRAWRRRRRWHRTHAAGRRPRRGPAPPRPWRSRPRPAPPCRRWRAHRAPRAPAGARSAPTRSGVTRTSRLKPRANTLRATASFERRPARP